METKKLKAFLENAIDEVNNIYDVSDTNDGANIGWLLNNVDDLKTLQGIAKAVKDQQTEMIEYHDDSSNWEFEYLITDEMIGGK